MSTIYVVEQSRLRKYKYESQLLHYPVRAFQSEERAKEAISKLCHQEHLKQPDANSISQFRYYAVELDERT